MDMDYWKSVAKKAVMCGNFVSAVAERSLVEGGCSLKDFNRVVMCMAYIFVCPGLIFKDRKAGFSFFVDLCKGLYGASRVGDDYEVAVPRDAVVDEGYEEQIEVCNDLLWMFMVVFNKTRPEFRESVLGCLVEDGVEYKDVISTLFC